MMLSVFQVVEMTCCCSVSAVRNENVEEKKLQFFCVLLLTVFNGQPLQ